MHSSGLTQCSARPHHVLSQPPTPRTPPPFPHTHTRAAVYLVVGKVLGTQAQPLWAGLGEVLPFWLLLERLGGVADAQPASHLRVMETGQLELQG